MTTQIVCLTCGSINDYEKQMLCVRTYSIKERTRTTVTEVENRFIFNNINLFKYCSECNATIMENEEYIKLWPKLNAYQRTACYVAEKVKSDLKALSDLQNTVFKGMALHYGNKDSQYFETLLYDAIKNIYKRETGDDLYSVKELNYNNRYHVEAWLENYTQQSIEKHNLWRLSADLHASVKVYKNKIVLSTTELKHRHDEFKNTPDKILYHAFGFLTTPDKSSYFNSRNREISILKDGTVKFTITQEEYDKIKPAINFRFN